MNAVLTVKALRSALAGPFDLALDPGACAAITGPSGSGKSLLLRMIADLDPNEGQVRLGDTDRAGMAATDWRKRVTYVAAESGWWADAVAEHFESRDRPAARLLADRLGLKAELLDGSVSRLSTGEKQRLALMRALLLGPAVLLLDEPTSALDDAAIERAEAVLRERMVQGTSIVMVTHDIRQAQRLALQHYRMSSGRMEAA
jgi:putative ABC transport system ATP-binding protein